MFHIGGIGWAYLGLVNGATTILVSEFDAAAGHRPARARTGHQCRVRPDDPADAGRRAGRGRARLLEPAFDRLRRLADHHAGAQGRAADVPLPAVRRLRPDRDDRRRDPAAARGPRRRRRAPAPAAIRRAPSALGRDADRRPRQRARLRRRRRRRGLAARAERDGRLLQPRRGDRGGADARRLAAHRRRRLPRRGRLPVPHRPDQGHDRERRGEHLPGRGRGGALAASAVSPRSP